MAQAVYGDSSLWYLIADANGLTGNTQLTAGQQIRIPSKLANVHNTSDTFRPYDAARSIGDLTPSTPKPPAKKKGCGILGVILLAIVAVVVAIYAPEALHAVAHAIGGALGTSVGVSTALAGAVIGAGVSVVTQGIAVATGLQDKFSWKGVALGAIGGAIGQIGALGKLFQNVSSPFLKGALTAVVQNAVTQGVGVATGLQDKFSWSGVAAAGLSGGVLGALGPSSSFKGQALRAGAAVLTRAAAKSVIDGTDFGDNLVDELPNAIGQLVAQQVSAGNAKKAVAGVHAPQQATGGDDGFHLNWHPGTPQNLVPYVIQAQRDGVRSTVQQAGVDYQRIFAADSAPATPAEDGTEIVVVASRNGNNSGYTNPQVVVDRNASSRANGGDGIAAPTAPLTYGEAGPMQINLSPPGTKNAPSLTSSIIAKTIGETDASRAEYASNLYKMLAPRNQGGYSVKSVAEQLISENSDSPESAKYLVTDLFEFDATARGTIPNYDGRIGALAFGLGMGTFAKDYIPINFGFGSSMTPQQYLADTVFKIEQARVAADYYNSLPDPDTLTFKTQADYKAWRDANGAAAAEVAGNIPIRFITFTAGAAASAFLTPLAIESGGGFLTSRFGLSGMGALTAKGVTGGAVGVGYTEASVRMLEGHAPTGDSGLAHFWLALSLHPGSRVLRRAMAFWTVP